MGRFTKKLIGGVAAAMLLAGAVGAQVPANGWLLADFERGNENELGYYFYVYASYGANTGDPVDHRPIILNQSGPGGENPYSFIGIADEGMGGSTAGGLRLSSLPPVEDPIYPGFGMGILLTKDDNTGYNAQFPSSDFSAVDSIVFWAKSGSGTLAFGFKVETTENNGNSNAYSTYWGVVLDNYNFVSVKRATGVGTTWERFSVALKPVVGQGSIPDMSDIPSVTNALGRAGDLKQEAYHGAAMTFVPGNATKIAWMVRTQDNTAASGAVQLYIDDVYLVGEHFKAPAGHGVCESCQGVALATPNKLISDFDNDPRDNNVDEDDEDGAFNGRQNFLGWYWYPYDGKADGGALQVTGDLIEDEHTMEEVFNLEDNGFNSNGIKVKWEAGSSADPDMNFAGVGTNLYDTEGLTAVSASDLFDASGYTGIFFRYNSANPIKVEVQDIYDISEAMTNGDDGQAYFVILPATSGWNTAYFTWSQLVTPQWLGSEHRRFTQPFQRGAVGKIQFKFEGTADGEFQIDDVYFIGDGSNNVRHVSSRAKASGIRASYNRGVVGVNWNSAAQISSGKISLVNTKGRVISSAPISKVSGNRITASLGRGVIPTGMYFVRIDARDVNGKRIVQQAPISIVK